MRRFVYQGMVLAAAMTTTVVAGAQEEEPPMDEAMEDEAVEEDAEAPAEMEEPSEAMESEEAAPVEESEASDSGGSATSSKEGADGGRFRFGVSGGPGFFSVSDDFGNSASFTYGGLDLRFGMQVNDAIGVYAQPVLGYYAGNDTNFFAIGGLLGAGLLVDYTLFDRLFVGGGLGYHVYNNPGGLSVMGRLGGYPIMGRSSEKVRRKGLMLSADLRVSFLDGLGAIVQPTFNVGYEAF